MSELKIKTNKQWRDFVYRYDVPENILKDQFDWTDEENEIDGFFQYKDYWYHLSEFMRAPETLKPWQGIHNDSLFSGVLIEVSDDGEQYRVGTFMG